MPFIPHTDTDIKEMLAAIGAPSIDALFDEIPAALRIKSLAAIPEALTEMEVGRLMTARAQTDGRPLCFRCRPGYARINAYSENHGLGRKSVLCRAFADGRGGVGAWRGVRSDGADKAFFNQPTASVGI